MTIKETKDDMKKQRWHFNKEIPVSVIALVALQFIGLIIYITGYQIWIKDQIQKHDWRLVAIETTRDTNQVNLNAQNIAVINNTISQLKVSVQRDINYIQESMKRIEDKLDRLIEK